MQDFRGQAVKNGVTLVTTGPCQFCGAEVARGVEECLGLFHELSARVWREKEYAAVHIFSIDAHSLQHSELHGRLSNHVHLLSLCLMLERGASSAMGSRKPPVERFLAVGREWPPLAPPPLGFRGAVTIRDVARATSADRPVVTRRWAEEVWEAWRMHQPWARRTVDRLLHD